MADITRRLRSAFAALLVAVSATACETGSQLTPPLPPAVGFRVDDGVLKLWTGTPCEGVFGMTLTFDVGTSTSTEQTWTAPKPGVRLDRMNLLPTDPGSDWQIEDPLPAGYDWTTAQWLNFAVQGPESWGARTEVAKIIGESPEHPPESYLFGANGWMNAAEVQQENGKSFMTICSRPAE
ncbi:hypothetical protein [Actinoplanes couchii]|uniref:Lipoprotein n=1 Tax=Actinoplanes couchii TaxID=403638 RepID=A0ABQ3XU93_9ACTN|nr:hypothetical protein [Actinoplanes couchii]MDR6319981.1 hypothetical protein [Actinoplanes couchii]GID62065.1 hypothetical protein Aco03nite_104690 [Actinoplanes couchii]